MKQEYEKEGKTIDYKRPVVEDAPQIYELVRSCPPLDLNSRYHYMLMTDHFAATSVVVEHAGRIVGYVSAYVHPHRADTLFVWQVAVDGNVRGKGMGRSMLEAILKREGLGGLNFIETTVTPSNRPSRAMFEGFARHLETHCKERPYFTRELFGDQGHEEERLLRIGPFSACCTTRSETDKEDV